MYPIDSETNKLWSKESVDMLTDKLRAEVDAELRARDESRGLSSENGYKAYVSDSNGRFVVDPSLAKAKHTGRERRLLLAKRMAEFCMDPQSEAEFIKTHARGDRRKQYLQRWIDRADADTSASHVEVQAQPLESSADGQPLTKKRGRPPGSKNRELMSV